MPSNEQIRDHLQNILFALSCHRDDESNWSDAEASFKAIENWQQPRIPGQDAEAWALALRLAAWRIINARQWDVSRRLRDCELDQAALVEAQHLLRVLASDAASAPAPQPKQRRARPAEAKYLQWFKKRSEGKGYLWIAEWWTEQHPDEPADAKAVEQGVRTIRQRIAAGELKIAP